MIALSVRQPWSGAIFALGNNIENRAWASSYLGPCLIHAGSKIDQSGIIWLEEQGFLVPEHLPTSCYLGRVEIVGCRRSTVAERYRTGGNFWAFGPWCFELADPEPFAVPIPGPGKPKFYEVDIGSLFAAAREGESLTLPLEV